MKRIIPFALLLLITVISGCKKETISNRPNLIIGTWDCYDYAPTLDDKRKGRPPVFISHLYEKGYKLKRNGLMWTRNRDGDNKMFTDKREECAWELHEDNHTLSLMFPGDITEVYEITELTRNTLTLRGKEGLWANLGSTYYFTKQ